MRPPPSVSAGGVPARQASVALIEKLPGRDQLRPTYPSGELLVDQGLIGTLVWRWSYNAEFMPFVFYDAARGKTMKEPTAYDIGSSWRSLRGYGVGLSWVRPGNFAINATLAWRAGTPLAQTDGGKHGARLYVQAQKSF